MSVLRCLLAASLLVACAPSEEVTAYQGSLGGSMTRNGVSGPNFVRIGVTVRVARREGVVARIEFSDECKVNVSAYSPTRVAADLRCEDTWTASGVTTHTVVRVTFTPFGA